MIISKKVLVGGTIFFVLNILDMVSTYLFLGVGLQEGNLFWSSFNTVGITFFDILIKLFAGVFLIVLFQGMCFLETNPRIPVFGTKVGNLSKMFMRSLNFSAMLGINILTAFVVSRNFLVYLMAMKFLG